MNWVTLCLAAAIVALVIALLLDIEILGLAAVGTLLVVGVLYLAAILKRR